MVAGRSYPNGRYSLILPLNPQVAAILRGSVRAPRAYIYAQLPVYTNISTNQIDPAKLGSALWIDRITGLRRTSSLDTASDTSNVTIANVQGRYSPFDVSATMSRYFQPGRADTKYAMYLGISQNEAVTIFPKGVFVNESTPNTISGGNDYSIGLNLLDQFSLFKGNVYAQFPPKLYGNQLSSFYNPNYNLVPTNASLGYATTWQCDAQNWMVSASDSVAFASDYIAVSVFVGTPGSPQSSASNPSTYTLDYVNGKVTFNTAIAANSVVSIDARPLAMAPELMLKHLFVDFGSFSSAFLKFDQTGIKLPIQEGGRDRPIIDVARDIVFATASRGLTWELFFDENGYIIFSESRYECPVVRTLVDTHDLLSISAEYSGRDIHNVIRATGKASNDQQLTSVAYDVRSISVYTQRSTYEIPGQFLSSVVGMDPGAAMAYMNGLTSSVLFANSTPTIQTEIDILPDPSLQVGDPIVIKDSQTGLNRNFYINQIDDQISDSWTMKCRISELKGSQDYQYGLAAYAGTPNPTAANVIQTMSGLINSVSINGTSVVSGGEPVVDSNYQPILASWDGASSLPISIVLSQTAVAANTYVWRFMYIPADCYYTIAGGPFNLATGQVGPTTFLNKSYDYINNYDTIRARRNYWPILRASDWLANDGVTSYPSTSIQTLNSSYTLGIAGGANPTLYGGLVYPKTDYYANTTTGFVGQPIWGAGTPFASAIGASSTTKFGVDFGYNATGSTVFIPTIKSKTTRAYMVIVAASTLGVIQTKKIPFNISV